MNVHTDRTTVVLGECDVLALTDALGAAVTVRTGGVWLTQETDGTDHVVRAGERFRVTHGGRTVLRAVR